MRARSVSSGAIELVLVLVLLSVEGGAGSEIPDMGQVCQPGVTVRSDPGPRARQHEAGPCCS